MDCSMYRREISRLLDGELDRSSVQELERHLELCADCRKAWERMTALNEELVSLDPEVPPLGLAARVKDRIAKERARAVPHTGIPLWLRVPLFALIVLTAVGLGNLAGRSVENLLTAESRVQTVESLVVNRTPSFANTLYQMTTGAQGQ
jgi:predicted anti-sigma-YlaC factor YlaD